MPLTGGTTGLGAGWKGKAAVSLRAVLSLGDPPGFTLEATESRLGREGTWPMLMLSQPCRSESVHW